MIVKRTTCKNGSICDKITLTEQENAEMNRCHEILRMRFEAEDMLYTKEQREMCEWWLQGLLRFEGMERMVGMAQSAPIYSGRGLVLSGNVNAKEADIARDTTPIHVRYARQAVALGEIASKMGAVTYGRKDDKNTIKFYTIEDDAHNRCARQQPAQYNRIEAESIGKRTGTPIPDECIFKDSFWSFENSDATGSFNWDFANKGKIDLRVPDWKERVEGHISLALLRKRQIQYVQMVGGWFALQEADEKYNSFNRSIINAMKQAYGSVYLGYINYGKEQINQFRAGKGTVYEEYTGQMIYNGTYAFAVPEKDDRLEELIRKYNLGDRANIDEIMDRISDIGGEYFSWR